MRALTLLALVLLVVGGLNWGLVGIFNFDLVQALFGESIISTVVYTLVGVAALFGIGIIGRLISGGTEDVCVPGHPKPTH